MKNVDLKNETPTCGNTLLCPVLGQTYNYFDDGKIRPSRRMEVVITEIIPFNEIDAETLESWKEEVEECKKDIRNHIDKLKQIKSTKITFFSIEEKLFLNKLNDYIEGCIDAGTIKSLDNCVISTELINGLLIADGQTPCTNFDYLISNGLIIQEEDEVFGNIVKLTAKGEKEVNSYE